MNQNQSLYSSRFKKAICMAVKLHATQTRKGSQTPYIAHLMSVSALVMEAGGGEDEAIAALLHDAVEDQGGVKTLHKIRRHFGTKVAEIVEQCTDAYTLPKPAWRKRKEDYIAHVAKATPESRLVSLADKVHNARSILRDLQRDGDAVWDKFNGGKDGTLWYYRSLLDTFKTREDNFLIDEFERVVVQIETVAQES